MQRFDLVVRRRSRPAADRPRPAPCGRPRRHRPAVRRVPGRRLHPALPAPAARPRAACTCSRPACSDSDAARGAPRRRRRAAAAAATTAAAARPPPPPPGVTANSIACHVLDEGERRERQRRCRVRGWRGGSRGRDRRREPRVIERGRLGRRRRIDQHELVAALAPTSDTRTAASPRSRPAPRRRSNTLFAMR